jgi:hypothetical protein
MPFPSGLRMLGERGSDNLVEWAWAMNAASSVLGSVLAMSVAIQFGLGATLVGGGLAYVLAWAMTTRVAGDRAGVALPRTSIPHFCISLRIY